MLSFPSYKHGKSIYCKSSKISNNLHGFIGNFFNSNFSTFNLKFTLSSSWIDLYFNLIGSLYNCFYYILCIMFYCLYYIIFCICFRCTSKHYFETESIGFNKLSKKQIKDLYKIFSCSICCFRIKVKESSSTIS